MGSKLHVYKRPNSNHWQCSTYLADKNHRVSTKEESLLRAKDFAENWYLELKGKQRAGELKTGKSFKFAADQFLREYEAITHGQRNPEYVKGHVIGSAFTCFLSSATRSCPRSRPDWCRSTGVSG